MNQENSLPTTKTNASDFISRVMSGRTAMTQGEAIRQLKSAGFGAGEIVNAAKGQGMTPTEMGMLIGVSLGVLGKNGDVLDYASQYDRRDGKDFSAATGYNGDRKTEASSSEYLALRAARAELLKKEMEEERKKQETLLQNLGALPYEQQVERLTDHFLHGGSIGDLVKNGYLTEKQGQEVKDTNRDIKDKADAEWHRKEEARKEELRKQNLTEEQIKSKLKEEKEKFIREREEQLLREKTEEARKAGDLRLAAVYASEANAIKAGMQISANSEMEPSSATKAENDKKLSAGNPIQKAALAEEIHTKAAEVQAKMDKGVSVSEKDRDMATAVGVLNIKDKLAQRQALLENAEMLAKSLRKTDASQASKAAGLAARQEGVVSDGLLNKVDTKDQRSERKVAAQDAKKTASSTDDIDDAFASAPVPNINKNFIAAKRTEGAEAPSQGNSAKLA